MKKEKNCRVPRPFGSTQMINAYHKLPEDQKQEMMGKIITFFIHQWFLGNGNLCGISYSINELSLFLNIDPSVIHTYMRDQVVNSKLWDKEIQQNLMEALLGQQMAWVFEDRIEIQNQLDLLKRSQMGKYTPFVSAEVNKALKLKLDSTTSLQSLVRSLSGGGQNGSINIFNQFNQQNNQESVGITQQEALQIIQEEQHKLPVNERERPDQYIEAKYDLDLLPEVCALKQQGVDTEKEGLKLNKNELNQITDNYKTTKEIAPIELEEISEEVESRFHHDLRRQIEYQEDLSEDDPELEQYDE